MADTFSKSQRSAVMSRIRSRGNKTTEIVLIGLLRENRILGWRRNQSIFGKPDFVFKKEKLAIFADGCFWHGCPRCYSAPATNSAFWQSKVLKNRTRDALVNRRLRKQGWAIVRVWECQLKKSMQTSLRIQRTLAKLRKL